MPQMPPSGLPSHLDRASLPATAPYRAPWEDYGPYAEPDRAQFDLAKLLYIVLRYRWLIVVVMSTALAAAAAVTALQSPRYAATARIEIMVPTAKVLEDLDVVAQTTDLRTFETAKEKLKSRDLARRVVAELRLAGDAGFLFPKADFSVQRLVDLVRRTSSDPVLAEFPLEVREQLAIDRLLQSLSVSLLRGTSLLEVSVVNGNAEQASQIANQVVRSYMDQQVDRTLATSDLAREFLDDQVEQAKTRLEASEAALVAYSKAQQLGTAGEDGALIGASITAMNDALAKAIQDRLARERLVTQIEAGQGSQLTQVLEDEAVQATRGKLAELEADYQLKLGTFKPDFPEMQRLKAQIAEVQRQLDNAMETIATAIRRSYEEAVRAETDLRQKLVELEAEQVTFRDKNIQYTILKREAESNRGQYQSLIDKRNELSAVSDVRRANIDVVDLAVAPKVPFEPSPLRNLLLALGGAAAFCSSFIYLRELLNNKFTTPDQIEDELGLPVLGIIPLADGSKLTEALADPSSSLNEAYRSLRTSLQFSGTDGAPRSLLVTSAEPGESKSTTSHKLAQEFAAIGNKVLVIDCDLRRPSQHRLFRVDNALGLTNLLTSTVEPDDVAKLFHVSASQPGLSLLSSGPMVPNPADLLSSARMGEVLRVCLNVYDMVILDGPPIVGLADALILSRLAEATMLVVAANSTPRKSVRNALKRLRSAGGDVVGAMLAKLDVSRLDYAYSYSYLKDKYAAYGKSGSTAVAAPTSSAPLATPANDTDVTTSG